MREIKFRGLNKYRHFVYGFLTTNGNFDSVIESFVDFNPAQQDPCGGVGRIIDIVDKETVGQFTGLADKNGVEIYEGDIVTFKCSRIGAVTFENAEYIAGEYALPPVSINSLETLEVIGNIHANSELLGDSK